MKKIVYVLLAVLILFGCARKEEPSSQVLAKVGNEVITMDDFNRRFTSMPPAYQESLRSNKGLLLEDLITEEILYKEALKRRLDADKEVTDLLLEAKKRIMVARLIQNEVEGKADVSDAEIQDFYNANKDSFLSPETFRASHILLGSLDEAVNVVDQLNNGASFEELAQEFSLDMTKSRGGDVGYFTYGQMVPEFEDACVKLNVGEIVSAPIKTQFGYHIIKLTDRKAPASLEFDQVKDRIEQSLANNKRRKVFDGLVSNLKTGYSIAKNLELLEVPGDEVVPQGAVAE